MDSRQLLTVLAEQLSALPIETHLIATPPLVERCSSFVANALAFCNDHRANSPAVDDLTVILSHDYHHVLKANSTEVRHLLNIYGANRVELERVRQNLASDSSLGTLDTQRLARLAAEGTQLDTNLKNEVDSAIAAVEAHLEDLRHAFTKIWNQASVDKSVIPDGLFFFVSHAT